MRAELDVRDAAREPYLAADRSPLRISRFVTRGGTQARRWPSTSPPAGWPGARTSSTASTASRTASGRPRAREARVVEWDVVHAATSPLPPADPPADAYFDARQTWVARATGEPRCSTRTSGSPTSPAPASARSGRSASRATCTIDPASARAALPDRAGPRRPRLPPRPARRAGRRSRSRCPPASASSCSTGTRSPPRSIPCASTARSSLAVSLPAADAAGAAARVPRDRRRRAARQLRRAGHLRPAARPDGPHEHQLARAQDDRRRQAAVRRRQGPRAHARRRADRAHLPRQPGLRRGPPALGRLRGRVLEADLSAAPPRRPVPARPAGPRAEDQSGRRRDVGARPRHELRPRPAPAALLLAAPA